MVEFRLNGEVRRLELAPAESLLDTLRERCGVTSPKDGCQPQGQCGCCLVLVDGQPKVSCALPAERCEGKKKGAILIESAPLPRAPAAAPSRIAVEPGGPSVAASPARDSRPP